MVGRAHQDRTFRTYGVNGVAEDYKTWSGAWVLVDGGYQRVQVSHALCTVIAMFVAYLFSSPAGLHASHAQPLYEVGGVLIRVGRVLPEGRVVLLRSREVPVALDSQ
jgi:hypothetical protein